MRLSASAIMFTGLLLGACSSSVSDRGTDNLSCAAVGKLGVAVAEFNGQDLPEDHTLKQLYDYYSAEAAAEMGLSVEETENLIIERSVELNDSTMGGTDRDAFMALAEPCVTHMMAKGKLN